MLYVLAFRPEVSREMDVKGRNDHWWSLFHQGEDAADLGRSERLTRRVSHIAEAG